MSWRLRALRVVLRVLGKPVLRYANLSTLRFVFALWNRFAEFRWRHSRASHHFIVSKTDYGEWLASRKSTRRVLLYLPGGGFLVRTPGLHRELVARLCQKFNADAAIVHYRLAPEHPYPAALDDAIAAYDALLDTGHDSENIVLAGDSAGGGLALSTALALRDRGGALPSAIVVFSPLADLSFSGDSRVTNARRDPMLPSNRDHADARYYIRSRDPRDPLLSPVYGDYTGIPPILAFAGSDEILLDDSVRTVSAAKNSGVDADVSVGDSLPHVWPIFGFLPDAAEAIDKAARFVSLRSSRQEHANSNDSCITPEDRPASGNVR